MPNLMLGYLAKEAAKLRFRSFDITLPTLASGGAPPFTGVRPQLMQLARRSPVAGAPVAAAVAGTVSRLIGGGVAAPAPAPAAAAPATATPMAFPPALFRAASNSKDDVDMQKGMHDMFSGLFDNLIDAIEYGFNEYRRTASLVDVRIMAAAAIGGRLDGPAIDGLIARAPMVAGWGGWDGMVRDAVAKGLFHQWDALARSVKVPGLPWYPAFIAFPGPMAPPMPNVPTRFMTLAHDPVAMAPHNLKAAMRSALQANMDYCMEFFESIAVALQVPLQVWKNSQQVTLVLGRGPVPSFAPPYVPVGPVVDGSIMRGQHICS